MKINNDFTGDSAKKKYALKLLHDFLKIPQMTTTLSDGCPKK